jgi:hypothetical protein
MDAPALISGLPSGLSIQPYHIRPDRRRSRAGKGNVAFASSADQPPHCIHTEPLSTGF